MTTSALATDIYAAPKSHHLTVRRHNTTHPPSAAGPRENRFPELLVQTRGLVASSIGWRFKRRLTGHALPDGRGGQPIQRRFTPPGQGP